VTSHLKDITSHLFEKKVLEKKKPEETGIRGALKLILYVTTIFK
jgi:hypothetical protein